MHLKPLGDLGQINLQVIKIIEPACWYFIMKKAFHLKDYPSVVSAVRNSDIVVNLIGHDRETR